MDAENNDNQPAMALSDGITTSAGINNGVLSRVVVLDTMDEDADSAVTESAVDNVEDIEAVEAVAKSTPMERDVGDEKPPTPPAFIEDLECSETGSVTSDSEHPNEKEATKRTSKTSTRAPRTQTTATVEAVCRIFILGTSTSLTFIGSASLLYPNSGAWFLSMRIAGASALLLGLANLIWLQDIFTAGWIQSTLSAIMAIILSLPTLLLVGQKSVVLITHLAFLAQSVCLVFFHLTLFLGGCCHSCCQQNRTVAVRPSSRTLKAFMVATFLVAVMLLVVALHPLYCEPCPFCDAVDEFQITEGGQCIVDNDLDPFPEQEIQQDCFCVKNCALDGCYNGCSSHKEGFCYSVEGSTAPLMQAIGSGLALLCGMAFARLVAIARKDNPISTTKRMKRFEESLQARRKVLEEALQIRKNVHGGTHETVATVLQELGKSFVFQIFVLARKT